MLIDSTLVGEPSAPECIQAQDAPVLVLGIGNVLLGDEGVGVHVLRALEQEPSLARVRLLDGGTGGVNLLAEFDGVRAVLLVDATRDGSPAGTVRYRQPRRVGELPRGLGAHDFGLKDLFAAAALLGRMPELHLYTIAVEHVQPMCTELSPAVAAAVPDVVARVAAHAAKLGAAYSVDGCVRCEITNAACTSPTDAQSIRR
jgi:hydrogenase maturation protease